MARFEKGSEVFEITSADARYATEQRKHLRDGWTRVADPRCEEPLGGEPINATLEAALRADPSDIGAALVYADWLQQQGHPRGALITVQHRLALHPGDTDLMEAERKILEDAADSLISRPLRAHLVLLRGQHEIALSRNFYEGGNVTFDHGFIREALVALKPRGADEDLLWELLRHPSARVLAKLVMRVERTRDPDLVAALITHGPRPPLRSLALHVEQHGGSVDLTGLDAAYPLLEELVLSLSSVWLGELELPHLRSLVLHTEHSDLGRILAARTSPSLEALTLSGEPANYQLAFEQPLLPKLHSLAFHQFKPTDPPRDGLLTCRLVVRSPTAAQLERLDLSGVTLPLEATTMLVENRARFARLVALRVGKARFVHGDGVDRLRAADYPVVVQR